MNNIKSIIFDFDGTLHDTMEIYYPAFKKGINHLKKHGIAEEYEVTRENISTFLGEKPSYAYDLIAKDAPDELKLETQKLVGFEMEKYMEDGTGRLYPNTVEVLENLCKKYDLYILSNARDIYLDKALKVYKIEKYFRRAYAAESFDYIPKDKILEKIIPNMEQDVIFVGDRFHDINAAVSNNIKSIFCTYGFGKIHEGDKADYKIDSIEEILKIL